MVREHESSRKMKTGKSLVDLAKELQRVQATAKDYIVPTDRILATVDTTINKVNVGFVNGDTQMFEINNHSANQLAQYTEIPKSYFDKLQIESPRLLSDNINHGLLNHKGESRLLRTLDGHVRGFLSSRYRILDGHDMLDAVLPVIIDKGMEVVSSELTEKRLFVKALSPSLTSEVKKGDAVQFGLTISTSDVGAGSVRVEPLIYRLVCENGLIMSSSIRKFHVGKNQADDDIRELLSDKTRDLTDAAFWASVRDVVLNSMNSEYFEREVDKLRVAANEPILNFDLPRVVELTMKATGLNGDAKKNSILAALASGNEGAGLTKWGLINSVTRAAQSNDFNYEESIDMERAAGQILELAPNQWKTISTVAA